MEAENSTDTKHLLLAAAEKLFVSRGYEAVSTREIADEAKVNLGAIQYHFGSKAKLFIATVHRLMESSGSMRRCCAVSDLPNSKVEAAIALCSFIRDFLLQLLKPEGPHACRLMFREIMTDTTRDNEMVQELLSTVVSEFVEPVQIYIQAILKILIPDIDQANRELFARSIIGQCSYYASHRPLVEYLEGRNLSDREFILALARHISKFSLRGLGIENRIIEKSILNVFKDD